MHLARSRGQLTRELLALHASAQFGAPDPVAARALAARMPTAQAKAVSGYVTARARGDRAGLLAAADAFERLGDMLSAADAAAAAVERGAPGAARRLAELAAHCEGARTPAMAAAGSAAVLTPRQREIARLVAQGLANRAIAERLVMSVRTVEGHVLRISRALGVGSREEIAEALGASPRTGGDDAGFGNTDGGRIE